MAIVVRLLGEVVADVDGRSVDLGAPRQRCVLAALAVDVGRVVPVDRLVERVWGADAPRRARATLHSYISRLRQALTSAAGVAIERRSGGYALLAEQSAVDLHRFRRLCERAGGEVPALTEALQLWRGEALTGLDGEWARAERDRLGREQLSAQHDLVDARLRSGHGDDLVVELSARADEHPLDERVASQYMQALYQAGRTADALEHHHRVRARLIVELGTDPGAQLQKLHRQILAADPALATSAADTPAVPRQLPAPPAPFVGRQGELDRLDAVLHASGAAGMVAVAAIAGAGGVGKTALALHWAHRVRSRFPDGQLFVNLRGHSASVPLSARQALDELLHALGVDDANRPLSVDAAAATYRSALADRRMLVVLDDALDVDQVRPLLPGTAGCTVVITSRNRFDGLVAREGARQVRLDVLAPEDALAVVGAVVGDARVTREEASVRDLVMLCGRLPLALRIAAAHLSTRPDRPVGEYVTELRTGDRLTALESPGDPGSAVRTTIDLSYAAQAPDTRRVFRLLGLVPGPSTTAPAVAALAAVDIGDAERGLRTLVAAHLVEEPMSGRYALHELLRLYALDHAARDGHVPLDRLIAWYAATADQAADALDPARHRLPHPAAEREDVAPLSFADARTALVWFTDEADNLAAVVRRAADHGPRWAAWRIADALKGFFVRGNTAQWPIVAETALGAAAGDALATAAMRNSAGVLGLIRGDHARAVDHFGKALDAAAAARWPLGQAAALCNLGLLHYNAGSLDAALDYLDRANAIATDDASCLVHAGPIRTNLGAVALALGRPAQAMAHLEGAVAAQRETGHDRDRGMALLLLAETHLHLGDLTRAADLADLAIDHTRRIGIRHELAICQEFHAHLALVHGKHDLANDILTAAAELAEGHHTTETDIQNSTATLHRIQHRLPEAAALHHRALRAAEGSQYRRGQVLALLGLSAVTRAQGDLDQAVNHANAALRLARHTGLRTQEAQALTARALAHLDRRDHPAAIHDASQARSIHTDTGHRLFEAQNLYLLARATTQSAGETEALRRKADHLLSEIGIAVVPDL